MLYNYYKCILFLEQKRTPWDWTKTSLRELRSAMSFCLTMRVLLQNWFERCLRITKFNNPNWVKQNHIVPWIKPERFYTSKEYALTIKAYWWHSKKGKRNREGPDNEGLLLTHHGSGTFLSLQQQAECQMSDLLVWLTSNYQLTEVNVSSLNR